MIAVESGRSVEVRTCPAHLAGVLNALCAGPVMDAGGEDAVSAVLFRGDCDVLRMDGGVYAPDGDATCGFVVSVEDAFALRTAAQGTHDRAAAALAQLPVGSGLGGVEVERRGLRSACAAAAALLADLGRALQARAAVASWAALAVVRVEDDGVCVYEECAVGCGAQEDAVQDALAQRLVADRLALALAAVRALGPLEQAAALRHDVTVACDDGGRRVVSMVVEVREMDDVTLEFLGAQGLDDTTRRELFECARTDEAVEVSCLLLG